MILLFYKNKSSLKTCIMTNSSKKVVVGVLGAAALGTAVYLLLSSEKGSDIRRKFADSANDLACRIGEMFTNAKEKVQSA